MNVGILRSIILAAAAISTCSVPVAAKPTLYECDVVKGVYVIKGELHDQTENYTRQMTPLTIDIESGVVRMGEKASVSLWRVVQEHDPKLNLDWVLKRAKGGSPWWDRADDVIRIRFYEGAVSVVHYFSGNLFSGRCKSLDN